MLNSRNIDDLRPDVAANCRVWMALCKAAGCRCWSPARYGTRNISSTATTLAPARPRCPASTAWTPAWPSISARTVKGHEYDDLAFFSQAAAIAKEMGFEWGGDWKSFPDRPHLQWSAHGTYTSAMVRAGNYPPAMPLYAPAEEEPPAEPKEEDEDMLIYHNLADMPDWARPSVEKCVNLGVIQQSAQGLVNVYEPNLQTIVLLDRLGLLDREVTAGDPEADQAD